MALQLAVIYRGTLTFGFFRCDFRTSKLYVAVLRAVRKSQKIVWSGRFIILNRVLPKWVQFRLMTITPD